MKFSLIIPAHNEEFCLVENTKKVLSFLTKKFPSNGWEIILVENGSSDNTKNLIEKLASEDQRIRPLILSSAGKGLAVKTGWDASDAEFLIFMDADLATDLKHLLELIKKLEDHDLVIGSRQLPDSKTTRTYTRKIFSFFYILAGRLILKLPCSDFQCGFKGIKNSVWKKISPQIQSTSWFFDTELLALAKDFKIAELPIVWQENRTSKNKSRVKVFKTARYLLKSLFELKKRLATLSKR